jgi:hypothetical protein
MRSTDLDAADDEAPLDPVQERLRRKLARLLLVSGGIMMLGFIAVFAAIVYKLGEREAAAENGFSADAPVDARIGIPPGSRVAAAALDGEHALLTLAGADGTTTFLLLDLRTGTVLGRYAAVPD